MANKRRVHKVGERIQALIAMELMRVADPRFYLVTITSVIVTPDLRNAKVYWTATGGKDRVPDVEEAFENARRMFKRIIGKELGIKFAPDLKFFYDDTIDTLEEVERLMSRIKTEPSEIDEEQHN